MNNEKCVLTTVVLGTFILGAGMAEAAQVAAYNPVSSTGNNYTQLDSVGGVMGGTNDVAFTWTGTIFSSSSDYTGPGSASNGTLFSPTPFFGYNWTAHDVQIFGPGAYSFDPSLGGGVPETGALNLTVDANQLGAHLLVDWNGNNNIDVALLWNLNTTFTGNMYTGAPNPDGNTSTTVWMLASTDGNGDGVNGIPLPDGGPFATINANFSLKGTLAPVPIPTAVWLFSSGLMGLFGFARTHNRSK